MSSDADYAAFLDKANQDVAPAEQQDLSKKGYGTKSVNTAVPKALESVEEYYVSDADEPFEPVALEYSGGSISAGEWFLVSRVVQVVDDAERAERSSVLLACSAFCRTSWDL